MPIERHASEINRHNDGGGGGFSWFFDDRGHLGTRESDGLITTNLPRFVPHVLAG